MSAYTTLILSETGLIHFWKMDELSGTTATDAVAALNGTISGTHAPTVGASGLLAGGTSYQYNSTGGNIDSAVGVPTSTTGGTAITIEAWIYTPTGVGNGLCICGFGDAGAFAGTLQLAAGRQVYWYLLSGSAQTVHSVACTADAWNHIAAVGNNSGTQDIYINGVASGASVSMGTPIYNAANTLKFWIGGGEAAGDLGACATFKICNVAIYNVKLTPTQISNHYTSGLSNPDSAATFSVTTANDTLAGSGGLDVSGHSGNSIGGSIAEGADTLSAFMYDLVTLAVTTADDTISTAANCLFPCSYAGTGGDDTLEGAASPVYSAPMVATGGDDTLVASSTQFAVTTLAVTEGADTLVGAATQTSTATLAVTTADDTLVASANTDAAVNATFAVTTSGDTLVAAGAPIASATLAVTTADDVLVALSGAGSGLPVGKVSAGALRYWQRSTITAGELVSCSSLDVTRLWGVSLRKAERSNTQLKGYAGLIQLPFNSSVQNGITFSLYLMDDGDEAADLGKHVQIGLTVKRISPDSTVDISTGAAAEQTVSVALSAVSGGLAIGTLPIAIADLPAGLAQGDLLLARIRRIGSDAVNDTCPGRAILLGIDVSSS